MSDMVRHIAITRLRQLHPELDETEAQRIVLARYYAIEGGERGFSVGEGAKISEP